MAQRNQVIEFLLLFYSVFSYNIEKGIEALLEVNSNRMKTDSATSSVYKEELVYACLSYGYNQLGKTKLAIAYAKKSLALNPENTTAKSIISKLKGK